MSYTVFGYKSNKSVTDQEMKEYVRSYVQSSNSDLQDVVTQELVHSVHNFHAGVPVQTNNHGYFKDSSTTEMNISGLLTEDNDHTLLTVRGDQTVTGSQHVLGDHGVHTNQLVHGTSVVLGSSFLQHVHLSSVLEVQQISTPFVHPDNDDDNPVVQTGLSITTGTDGINLSVATLTPCPIHGVASPTSANDCANKSYVDSSITSEVIDRNAMISLSVTNHNTLEVINRNAAIERSITTRILFAKSYSALLSTPTTSYYYLTQFLVDLTRTYGSLTIPAILDLQTYKSMSWRFVITGRLFSQTTSTHKLNMGCSISQARPAISGGVDINYTMGLTQSDSPNDTQVITTVGKPCVFNLTVDIRVPPSVTDPSLRGGFWCSMLMNVAGNNPGSLRAFWVGSTDQNIYYDTAFKLNVGFAWDSSNSGKYIEMDSCYLTQCNF